MSHDFTRNGLTRRSVLGAAAALTLPQLVRPAAAADTVDIERVLLEDDEVYVLGDNRDNSIDSRTWGPLKLDRVVGRVMVRFWPVGRFGTVDWS
jgi:type IV secretory pathway protease TraF